MVTKLKAVLDERYGPMRRKWGGVRYYDIARRAGIPKVRLYEYLTGTYEIPWHHQIAICELLGCAPDDIVGDEDPQTYDLTDS